MGVPFRFLMDLWSPNADNFYVQLEALPGFENLLVKDLLNTDGVGVGMIPSLRDFWCLKMLRKFLVFLSCFQSLQTSLFSTSQRIAGMIWR